MTPINTRAEAGAAYESAARAYIEAWIDLAAHDRTLPPGPGFGEQPHVAAHGEFLPHLPDVMNDISGRTAERTEQLIRGRT